MRKQFKITKALITSMVVFQFACNGSSGESDLTGLRSKVSDLERQVIDIGRERDALKEQLESTLNAPARLLGQVQVAVNEGALERANISLKKLAEVSAQSPERKQAELLVESLKKKLEEKAVKEAAEVARKEAEEKKRLSQALSKMNKSHDKVDNVSWYKPSGIPILGTHLSTYIGITSDNQPWLRVKAQYEGDDWIFADSLVILCDGVRFEKNVKFERDNGSGKVWEVADFLPNAEEVALLKKIIASKETIVRFSGRGNRDKTITQKEKGELQNVLDAFAVLSAKA